MPFVYSLCTLGCFFYVSLFSLPIKKKKNDRPTIIVPNQKLLAMTLLWKKCLSGIIGW